MRKKKINKENFKHTSLSFEKNAETKFSEKSDTVVLSAYQVYLLV
jgi:hypothetical protein